MRLALLLIVSTGLPIFGSPCVTGQVQSYIDLGSTGCTAGAYTLYGFGFSQSETGGASLPSLDSVTIDPLVGDSTVAPLPNNTGVLIVGNWNAAAGQSVMYTLSFSVELTQAGFLSGVFNIADSTNLFPASIPGGSTWGITSVLGFSSGQITDDDLYDFVSDCIPCVGGGESLPLPPGIVDDAHQPLAASPFLNVEVTKIFQPTSGNIQDLGMWIGTSNAPEPRYLLPVGLSLLTLLLRKRAKQSALKS